MHKYICFVSQPHSIWTQTLRPGFLLLFIWPNTSMGPKVMFFNSKEGVLQLSLTSEGTLGTYVLINACGVPILGILLLYLPTCLLNMVPVPCLVFILILKPLTWYRYLAFGTGLTHLWPVTGVTFHILNLKWYRVNLVRLVKGTFLSENIKISLRTTYGAFLEVFCCIYYETIWGQP